MKTKVAVTGARGQIGRRLVALGAIPLECDIRNKAEIANALDAVQPDLIIHTAGVSSIDEAQKDYEHALGINVWGFSALSELAGDGKVVLLSSEHVFDGVQGDYKEDDEPNPINNYGFSKLGAEGVARLYDNKIVRLSRGFSKRIGSDIYDYLLDLQAGKDIRVPDFIRRSYCHLDYIAQSLMYHAEHIAGMPKILHIGGKRSLSFYELMSMAAGTSKDRVSPRAAESKFSPRPLNCGLDTTLSRTLLFQSFTPEQSVALMIAEKPHAN